MTDRELLELAALAGISAGMPLHFGPMGFNQSRTGNVVLTSGNRSQTMAMHCGWLQNSKSTLNGRQQTHSLSRELKPTSATMRARTFAQTSQKKTTAASSSVQPQRLARPCNKNTGERHHDSRRSSSIPASLQAAGLYTRRPTRPNPVRSHWEAGHFDEPDLMEFKLSCRSTKTKSAAATFSSSRAVSVGSASVLQSTSKNVDSRPS